MALLNQIKNMPIKLLLLFFFLIATPAFAISPTVLDGTPLITAVEAGGGDTSITYSYTSPSGGSNRLMVILIGWGCGNKPTTVTYGGTSMTLTTRLVAQAIGDGILVYLANPTAGAANVVVSWTGAAACTLSAATFTLQDAKQTSPQDVAGANSGFSTGTSKTQAITTSTNGDIILTWIIVNNGAGLAANSPQVSLGIGGLPGFNGYMGTSLAQTTAGAITTGFTWTNSTNGDMFVQALLVEAPAAAAVPDLGVFTIFE